MVYYGSIMEFILCLYFLINKKKVMRKENISCLFLKIFDIYFYNGGKGFFNI